MKKREYPPSGTFYMYPCYDGEEKLIGFASDYEAEGAYGSLCEIEIKGLMRKETDR